LQAYPSGQNRQKKNSLKECGFVISALKVTVPFCQKYTPTDCFFGEEEEGKKVNPFINTHLLPEVKKHPSKRGYYATLEINDFASRYLTIDRQKK